MPASERSYEIVARNLEREILAGERRPGSLLPPETALAASLGVNRSTLREALRSLEQNGYVARDPGRKKLRITLPHPRSIAQRYTKAMVGHGVTFRELYEAMRVIEPACAEAAAGRASAHQIAELDDNLELTRLAIERGDSLVTLDISFHRLVADGAQSRALEMMREPLGELFYPAFEAIMARLNVSERLFAAHRHIVAAIKLKDSETARLWMRRHIDDFQRACELAQIDMDLPIGSGRNLHRHAPAGVELVAESIGP